MGRTGKSIFVQRWLNIRRRLPQNSLLLLCFLAVAVPWFLANLLGLQRSGTPLVNSSQRGPKGCVGWRATHSCHPYGERNIKRDKTCSDVIRKGSGYCECEGGITAARVACGAHRINCKRECKELGYDQGALVALPQELSCREPAVPYEASRYLPTSALEPLLPRGDPEELARGASRVWDTIDAVISKFDVEGVKLAGVRNSRRDWVLEGRTMRRKDVKRVASAVSGYLQSIPHYPSEAFEGRGVVMVGGGLKYMVPVWVNVHMLRLSGCRLPVEVWFPVEEYPSQELEAALGALGAVCRRLDFRNMDLSRGFAIKAAALVLSRFREVIFLDADNIAVQDPTGLLDSAEYQSTGAMFWQDYWDNTAAVEVPEVLGMKSGVQLPAGSFESGQMVVDKARHWKGLLLALYLNSYATLFFELLSCYLGKGDKETFAYSLLAANETFFTISTPPASVGITRRACQPPGLHCHVDFFGNTMLQHDLQGRPLFLHANLGKWTLRLPDQLSDYHRRWVLLRPGNVDWTAWAEDALGYDVEAEVYELLRKLKCRPWFETYQKMRLKMGDKNFPPPLTGFHPIVPGIDFRKIYRKGFSGNYQQLFQPTNIDVLTHHWNRYVHQGTMRMVSSMLN